MDIVQQIASGDLDGSLDAIQNAVRTRQRYLEDIKAAENQIQLTPGTRVVICGNLRPKYMLGEVGVVLDKPSDRDGCIQVELDQAIGRYGKVLGIPANCLRAA